MAPVLFIAKPSSARGGRGTLGEGREGSQSLEPFLVWARILGLGSPACPEPLGGRHDSAPLQPSPLHTHDTHI